MTPLQKSERGMTSECNPRHFAARCAIPRGERVKTESRAREQLRQLRQLESTFDRLDHSWCVFKKARFCC